MFFCEAMAFHWTDERLVTLRRFCKSFGALFSTRGGRWLLRLCFTAEGELGGSIVSGGCKAEIIAKAWHNNNMIVPKINGEQHFAFPFFPGCGFLRAPLLSGSLPTLLCQGRCRRWRASKMISCGVSFIVAVPIVRLHFRISEDCWTDSTDSILFLNNALMNQIQVNPPNSQDDCKGLIAGTGQPSSLGS